MKSWENSNSVINFPLVFLECFRGAKGTACDVTLTSWVPPFSYVFLCLCVLVACRAAADAAVLSVAEWQIISNFVVKHYLTDFVGQEFRGGIAGWVLAQGLL